MPGDEPRSDSSKLNSLKELKNKRIADRTWLQFSRLEDIYGGAFDHHDWLSPWTISACNFDADVLVFLQDWSSIESLRKLGDPRDLSNKRARETARLGYTADIPTNPTLISVVKDYLGLDIRQTYVTNLFAFIKHGDIGSPILKAAANHCAIEYALPQLEIVRPRLAVCVGVFTFNSLRRALDLPPVQMRNLATSSFQYGSTRVCGSCHTGGRGMANAGGRRGLEQQWADIGRLYRDIVQASA